MRKAFRCIYNEIDTNPGKNQGILVLRTRKFDTFREAVAFSRLISNTNVNMIGKPIIDIEEAKS